ncbi:LytTR family DNA-binding domain-containing protein [Chryseolinea sp. T2]|uniref:LytR/AlgR family response regulator transcription factor n=1 Tax=Chryseolinea sp. T2 TaxID=3129255 RepID=UPI003077681C
MNVLIIEDEPLAAQRLASLIDELLPNAEVLQTIDSIKRSVQWLNQNDHPDLILMDIHLADGISFDIFEKCTVSCPVIFTTAYDQYALRAFKVNSIDYILKPVDKTELAQALKKFETSRSGQTSPDLLTNIQAAMRMLTRRFKERFIVKVGDKLRSIEVSDVQLFLSEDKTTFAQTSDGRKHVLDHPLDEIQGLLNPELFFRVNRKYIVAVSAIRDISSYTNSRLRLLLKVTHDDDVIVARERVNEFREWLDR